MEKNKMATQQNGEAEEASTNQPTRGIINSVEQRYQKLKEHAEKYPYVWASYTVVYGGLFLWMGYRWRRLRKTEDRVRTLQQRLRKLVEDEDAAAATKKASSSADKAAPK